MATLSIPSPSIPIGVKCSEKDHISYLGETTLFFLAYSHSHVINLNVKYCIYGNDLQKSGSYFVRER